MGAIFSSRDSTSTIGRHVTHDNISKVTLRTESLYLLAFTSWLHHFEDLSKWEFRAANSGFFVLVSIVLLFIQMITLFDLAYEEELANYHCLGKSAYLSATVCSILVTVIVCLKMLAEERRCISSRLVLIRHASEFSFFNSFYHFLYGNSLRRRSLKLILLSLFQAFREYGVITFVYVAAMEQIMLFETILDYIINSVVVLLIAEADELLFHCLAKIELEIEFSTDHSEVTEDEFPDITAAGGYSHADMIRTASTLQHPLTHPEPQPLVDHKAGTMNPIEHFFLKPEGTHSSMKSAGQNEASEPSDSGNDYMPLYGEGMTKSPRNIHEMTCLHLTKREYEAFVVYDYWILRCNVIAMLVPLLHGKLTGYNCSERSQIRVSEIGMLVLLISRVCLLIYVDNLMARHKLQGMWAVIRHTFWSLLEHGIPCLGYVGLMYFVFVVKLKPPPATGSE